jgi:hypothetical protein
MAPHQLPDGTPVFHPLGELLIDRDEDRICCGLCGRWYRSLPSHLRHKHDWAADEYREAFGLNVQRPLDAPGTTERRSRAFKRRLDADPRLRAGMRIGLALAQTGVLNELGRRADAQRGRALERRRRTQQQGRRVSAARIARFREHRERRARELGFADVDALVRQRYVVDGASVAEIADALGCAAITLIDEMERLGIPRRPEDERLALGRAVLAERRAEAARALEARVGELGFPDVRAYLSDRIRARRWRQVDVAAELGVHISRIRKLMRQHGVRSARGAAPADQLDPDGYQRRRLSVAQHALAARRRARDDEIARRLGFADIAAWYAARRAAGATNREMMEEAQMGEKWLRRLARESRQRRPIGSER